MAAVVVGHLSQVVLFEGEQEGEEGGGGDLELVDQVPLLEDCVRHRGQRAAVGELGDLEHVDSPPGEVGQVRAS